MGVTAVGAPEEVSIATSDYIPRLVDSTIDALFGELPALMLTGPRGIGKTTTALQRARSVVRLDHPGQASAFRADPDAALGALPGPVLIDEWQEVPESMAAVKRAVDAGSGPGRFLITGSVRARTSAGGWPATGRVVPVPMHGLTVAELERSSTGADVLAGWFGDSEPTVGPLAAAPNLPGYIDHAVRGGFPDALHLSDPGRSAWFEGYVEQLVHYDATELAAVRSPSGMDSLLRAVAANSAGLPHLNALGEAAGVSHRTVTSYLDLLEELRIIDRVPAWSTNRLSRLVKTPKYYVVDPGLTAFLTDDSRQSVLSDGGRLGRLIDTFVTAQLRPLLRLRTPAVRMFHVRDANGEHEVDLVLESASGEIVGVEIKASNSVGVRDARHLQWLRSTIGEAFVRGIVLHTGESSYPVGERMWAVPIAALWK